jgi:hypothetical protein
MHLLQPTTRNRVQVLLMFLLGTTFFGLAFGGGLPLLGRIYNPDLQLHDPNNGRMSKTSQEIGLVLLVYMGTLGTLLFANMIPGLVVLDFSLVILRALSGMLALVTFGAMLVSFFLLIEPHHTFSDTPVVGHQDPLLMAIGGFYVFAFSYLFLLSGAVFVRTIPWLKSIRHRITGAAANKQHIFFLAFMLFLG